MGGEPALHILCHPLRLCGLPKISRYETEKNVVYYPVNELYRIRNSIM